MSNVMVLRSFLLLRTAWNLLLWIQYAVFYKSYMSVIRLQIHSDNEKKNLFYTFSQWLNFWIHCIFLRFHLFPLHFLVSLLNNKTTTMMYQAGCKVKTKLTLSILDRFPSSARRSIEFTLYISLLKVSVL